jgi:Sec-independent protein translocase protein TatA
VTTAEMIGIVVLGLSSLIGIFTAVYRPLSENTKEMKEQNEKLEKQNKEIEEYKEHVRKGQKQQWDEIERNEKEIGETKHELELCRLENGGKKHV